LLPLQQYSIRLNSGRDVFLYVLFQYPTYSGWMEGIPTASINEWLVQRALEYTKQKLWDVVEPVLIPPKELPIELPEGANDLRRLYKNMRLVRIPAIACLATWDSYQPARDEGANFSCLNIVWFQEEFALPIAPEVVEQIKGVDWERHAEDGWY